MHRFVALPTVIAALAISLAACEAPETAQQEAASTSREITAQDLAHHIEILASDDFEGRAPGTPGGEKTVAYLTEAFKSRGAAPAFDEGYGQTVSMIEVTATDITPLRVEGPETDLSYAYGKEMMVWTKRVVAQSAVEQSDMVFVGYGVVAPEYGWNDYAGVDVRGKTVVMLVNDPGYATQDETLFNGRAMTYYGRWTYKYEEAARQGAAAAIIIHETAPASYPWSVVENSWSGPQLDLQRPDNNMDRIPIEGWVTHDVASQIMAAAGHDLRTLEAAALRRDFKAVPLGLKASVALENSIRSAQSDNVVAMVEGSARPDEAVLYVAHWDHLGRGQPLDGDEIYNGAVDNATGVAGLLEIAERFANGPAPERSVIFLAVTAEESGLLGSAHYAQQPAVPLARTVAVLNMDAMTVSGPTKDVVVIGHGKSELEQILAAKAAQQNRVLKPEDAPEQGFFYRSDHFNFAKRGVPALFAEGGIEHVERGAEWGRAQADDYVQNRYHKPSDEFDPNWDLSGLAEDVALLYEVGVELANSEAWPNWYEDAEFRAARDRSRAGL
ncbi:MAG: M28 family metallopeptidase [Sphingomonadales bacterium]